MKKEGEFPYFQNKEELKTSIDQGFDVNIPSIHLNGVVPLAWASQVGLFDCVKILLEANANTNVYNFYILRYVCLGILQNLGESRKCLKLLIEYGLNVNAQTNFGDTFMHNACTFIGSFDLVKLLINIRADPNIRNNDGRTVLETALNYRVVNNEIVKLLLNNGAKLPSGKHEFSEEVSVTIGKLRRIKRVLITFFALSKKTGAIHKDLRNPIAKMVWETREDDVWDQKILFEKKSK
jgi:ankyrin repeat protein